MFSTPAREVPETCVAGKGVQRKAAPQPEESLCQRGENPWEGILHMPQEEGTQAHPFLATKLSSGADGMTAYLSLLPPNR